MGRNKIGFGPQDPNEYEFDGNTQEVIPLYIDQPGVEDLDEWYEDE